MFKNRYRVGQRVRITTPSFADHTDGFATGAIVTITDPHFHSLGVVQVANSAGKIATLHDDEFETVD
jgi:hypothetical protein